MSETLAQDLAEMKNFDWLRLGGMIARKWPMVDFGEVDIRPIEHEVFNYRIPLLIADNSMEFTDDGIPKETKYEDIGLEKAIIEGRSIRVGYGPRANVLLISTISELIDQQK